VYSTVRTDPSGSTSEYCPLTTSPSLTSYCVFLSPVCASSTPYLNSYLGRSCKKKKTINPTVPQSWGYSHSALRSSAVGERTLALRIRPRDATPAPRIRPRDARQPTRTSWSKRDLPGLHRSAGCTRGRGAWCTPRWRRSPRSSPGPQLWPQRGSHRTQDTNEAFSGLLLVGFDGSTGGRRVARVFYS
jgi:hypothetical protein